MACEKPIIQLIDTPRYPLKKERLGKICGTSMGGIIGGLLIVAFMVGKLYFKSKMEKEETPERQN